MGFGVHLSDWDNYSLPIMLLQNISFWGVKYENMIIFSSIHMSWKLYCNQPSLFPSIQPIWSDRLQYCTGKRVIMNTCIKTLWQLYVFYICVKYYLIVMKDGSVSWCMLTISKYCIYTVVLFSWNKFILPVWYICDTVWQISVNNCWIIRAKCENGIEN